MAAQIGQLLTASQARAAVRATRVARHWIEGQWRDSADHRDSINPASGERIGAYVLGKEDETADAVAAAVRVFRDTDWKTNRELRVRVLNEMADRFEARTAELSGSDCCREWQDSARGDIRGCTCSAGVALRRECL